MPVTRGRRERRRPRRACLLALAALVGVASCSGSPRPGESTAPPATVAPAPPGTPWPSGSPAWPARPVDDCSRRGGHELPVRSAAQLRRALRTARPGQRIRLADGVYAGGFVTRRSGRPDRRLALCGSRRAVLRGPSNQNGYVLHLDGASYWTLSGFTVTRGLKGVVVDHGARNLLTGLALRGIGQEAIHLRAFSSDNLLLGNRISQTGRKTGIYGEGVYVGSAVEHWCRYTGCRPDASDHNYVVGNQIGPGVTAESVDVKEGTSGGVVAGNHFDGRGMSSADSWMDVKGNRWRIEDNDGSGAPRDGFQVHVKAPGWGRGNVFAANTAQLPVGGYAVRVGDRAAGTVVRCDNRVAAGARGVANVPCA
jgi:hypothetical protein